MKTWNKLLCTMMTLALILGCLPMGIAFAEVTPSTLPVNETFTGVAVADLTEANGWSSWNSLDGVSIVDAGGAYGNVMKLTNTNSGIIKTFSKIDGKFKITGAFKNGESASGTLFDLEFGNAESTSFGNSILRMRDGGLIYSNTEATTSMEYMMLEGAKNTWYTFEVMGDTQDAKNYSVAIYDENGTRLAYKNGIPYNNPTGGLTNLKITKPSNGSNTNPVFIDNLTVETYTGNLDSVLLDDNFDKYEKPTHMNWIYNTGLHPMRYGWTAAADLNWPYSTDSTEDDGTALVVDGTNKYMRLDQNEGIRYRFTRDNSTAAMATSGKIKISASVRLNKTDNLEFFMKLLAPNSTDGALAVWYGPWNGATQNNGQYKHTKDDGTEDTEDPTNRWNALSMSTNGSVWSDITVLLDLDSQTYDVSIVENGVTMASVNDAGYVFLDSNAENAKTTITTGFGGVEFYSKATDNTVDVDNVKIEWIDEPDLAMNDVTVTDYLGSTAPATGTISPALTSINLNFGTQLAETTTTSQITLTPEGGAAVSYTPQIVGNVYKMNLSQCLTPGTKYTLAVADTVTSAYGGKIEGTVTMDLNTGSAAAALGKITGVTIDGAAVTNISQVAQGASMVVKTPFANPTNETAGYVVIAAYYNGPQMIGVQLNEVTNVAAGTVSANATSTFTIPSVTGVTKAQIYLWDGLGTLVSYGPAYSVVQ